ncbi:Adenylate cyclase 1 [Ascidiaceihabitans donghaensis]|uniref:Adenylate cyclase 1 n=1 Tax=Ascidiaceihabitans donghaensis TaxID=1510460 RepID=A0A2R8BIT8_9RHOB|nr:adenylate/guanylate cyclase domain-containing protein [Ascidiaceihabitans donghaensis]SPH22998.1 Adenylate cyclase 1 [Ascidiaceihabitans donghaensis]
MADVQSIDTSLEDAPGKFAQVALERHKQEGLNLAVRARWAAIAVIAVLLPFLNPRIEVLYSLALLALVALNGWFLRRVGRVGRSGAELFFIAFDVLLLTFALLFPNPFNSDPWPTSVVYEFQTFMYYFVFLTLGTLSYSWRTILALGHWSVASWLVGTALIWWLGVTYPQISAGIAQAFPSDTLMAQFVDPNNVNWDRRIQEVVVLLICCYTLALTVRRFETLLLGNAGLERERANLSRYFSPNVVHELSHNDEPLKQIRNQDIAVLFVDIVGFTALSANRPPEEVIRLLRQFHGRMEAEVFAHDGTLDKYLGDGLMATFGTPVAGPCDASNALRCARAMMRAMEGWNDARESEGLPAIHASFGIHYGPVVVGDIGANRLEFAVIGNTVNVASRLEALTRPLGVSLIVSDDAYAKALSEKVTKPHDPLDAVGEHVIRGLDAPMVIWTA